MSDRLSDVRLRAFAQLGTTSLYSEMAREILELRADVERLRKELEAAAKAVWK